MGWSAPETIALIRERNVQRLPLHIGGIAGPLDREPHPHSHRPSENPASAFLAALEHNFCITSTCSSRQCSSFTKRKERCRPGNPGNLYCPEEALSITRGLPLFPRQNFRHQFQRWYYNVRVVAMVRRNAELQRRVHAAVFRLLSYLSITQNATGIGRLPVEIMDLVGSFVGGVLTDDQVARVRKLAADMDESKRIHNLLQEDGAREEWLFNGGFWWQKGHAAAKAELGYDSTAEWPPVDDLEAVLDFLAFQPVAMPWSYGKGEVVMEVMSSFEAETDE